MVLTFFWRYHFAERNITWGYAVIDATVATVFWRQAQRAVVALPLFYVHIACVFLYFMTTVLQITHWWMMAIANRLFEFEILYVSGCALFRITKLKAIKKGRANGAPESLG